MTSPRSPEQYARINPDSKPVLYLVLMVTTVIAAVAFAVSFAGLAAVSEWAQIPPRLSWALPVFIDGAIFGFTIMILVFRARGESTLFAWVVLIAFTVISVGANAAHAYAEGSPEDWRTIVGSGLAGLAPAGLAVFIHGIARLLVAPPQQETNILAEARVSELVAEETQPPGTDDDDPDDGVPATGGGDEAAAELNGQVRETPPAMVRQEALVSSAEGAQARSVSLEPRLEDPEGRVLTARDEPVSDGAVMPQPGRTSVNREALVERALGLSRKGKTQREISEELEIPQSTIGRWIRQHKQEIDTGKHLRAVN